MKNTKASIKENTNDSNVNTDNKQEHKMLWSTRKRNALGLPWTFTVYKLSDDRLFVNTGFINKREDEVRLYRITDVALTRSLGQRIFGLGTVHIESSDKSLKNFDIINIKDSEMVKEMVSELVESSRIKNRVYARENMVDYDIPGDEDHDGIPDIAENFHDHD